MPFSFVLVHLRNIDASELEIVQFGLSFGKITNVLNLRKKNQVSFNKVFIDLTKVFAFFVLGFS